MLVFSTQLCELEPVSVDLLRSPGIDPQPGVAGLYDKPFCRSGPLGYMVGGVDSSKSIPGLHKRLQIRALIDFLYNGLALLSISLIFLRVKSSFNICPFFPNYIQWASCRMGGGGGGLSQTPPPSYFLQNRSIPCWPVFLNVYGAQESIPRNEFRQPI